MKTNLNKIWDVKRISRQRLVRNCRKVEVFDEK